MKTMDSKIRSASMAIVLVLCIGSIQAGEPAQKSSVEKRLQRIDLKVLFDQYEKVTRALYDTRLQMALSQAEQVEVSEKERKAQDQRLQLLERQRDQLRMQIREMGQELGEGRKEGKKKDK